MPTPFYHLSIAYELAVHPALPQRLRAWLDAEWSAFLLGKIAPDVQVVSRQPRQDTHFYTLPPSHTQPPWENMQAHYPVLADAVHRTPAQAAFLTGYFCHLQADEIWLFDIFLPYFGPDSGWEIQRQRSYLHNVLRAYLDYQLIGGMPPESENALHAAAPCSWLPFVQDEHLCAWRDFVAGQLRPGAPIQTIAVFASRQGRSVDEFYSILSASERMDTEVFAHVPRPVLAAYRQNVVDANLRLIQQYLGGTPESPP